MTFVLFFFHVATLALTSRLQEEDLPFRLLEAEQFFSKHQDVTITRRLPYEEVITSKHQDLTIKGRLPDEEPSSYTQDVTNSGRLPDEDPSSSEEQDLNKSSRLPGEERSSSEQQDVTITDRLADEEPSSAQEDRTNSSRLPEEVKKVEDEKEKQLQKEEAFVSTQQALTSVPVVSSDDCAKCTDRAHLNASGFFTQFRACKTGIKEEDTPWCKANLCVIFEGRENPITAKCVRTLSQEEYIEAVTTDERIESIVNLAVTNGLIANGEVDVPQKAIMLSDEKGNDIFLESTGAGMHWPYLLMPGYVKTEAWWSYCGLSTLIVALNYLMVPPPWFMAVFRWWSEVKVLDMYPLMKRYIDQYPPGTALHELGCIAEDLGLRVDAKPRGSEQEFREALKTATSASHFKKAIMLVNYHRNLVAQPGSGHWSPVAAYAPKSDMVLIMDVARYKFPPHWVRVKDLVRAMDTVDTDSDLDRGWLLLERNGTQPSHFRKCKQFFKHYADAYGAEPWEANDAGLSGDAVREITVSVRDNWH
eukprot:TRINITY_DN5584_c0_g2_i1.p1 TRINITY_DN5584_c0_g2~~TRINITY_DN5584_c0_g2_i1.p1  ORF type:complete len:532 (-),score=62.59 TRINITY_DN5584_c0_g2_i1:189-1784(-)